MREKPRTLQWTPQLVQRFWDYQSQFPQNYFAYQFGAEIAKSLAPHLRGRARVLDYGCGMGFLLPHLARYAAGVAGADVSRESLRRVNETCGEIKNFLGAHSIDELMTADQKFDAIVAVEVIEHLYDDQLDEMLSNIRRLLSPNGIVIFTTPNEEDLLLNEIYCPETEAVFHRWQHVRSWSGAQLAGYLTSRGFRTIRTYPTNLASVLPDSLEGKAKWLIKRALGWHSATPHLVCIVSVA